MIFVYGFFPLPAGLAWGRARLEWEAYTETLAATAEVYGVDAAEALRGHIVGRAGVLVAKRRRRALRTDRSLGHSGGASDDDAIVLLSPACASFDQFTDFEDRGEAFRTAVHDLTVPAQRGVRA